MNNLDNRSGLSLSFWRFLKEKQTNFSQRKEIRLSLPNNKYNDLIKALEEYELKEYSYGSSKNKKINIATITIYLGPNDGRPTAMIPRIRLFDQSFKSRGDIKLPSNGIGVLELKIGRKDAKTTYKQKETILVGDTLKAFLFPERFELFFDQTRKSILIPDYYPKSKVDLSVVKRYFKELGEEPIVPNFATLSIRKYFLLRNEKGDEIIRVSVDFNKKYFIFFGLANTLRLRGIYKKKEEDIRVDIKAFESVRNKICLEIANKLQKMGAFKSRPTHSIGRGLYIKHRKEILFKEGLLINELPLNELESKLQMFDGKPEEILYDLKKDLTNGKIDNFSILPDLSNILCHEGKHICYGFRDKKRKLTEGITIIEDKSGWHIKKKGLDKKNFRKALLREEIREHLGHLNQKEKKEIIKKSSVELDHKLEKVGTFWKRKKLLSVLNQKSGRQYAISSSFCKTRTRNVLSQVEIEYIAMQNIKGSNYKSRNPIREIREEMIVLENYLLSKYRDNLFVTKLTKFGWLLDSLKKD